jgi:hypothetical protein
MLTARRRQLHVELVDLRNSGDTAGSRDRVVGYGSFIVHPREDSMLSAGPALVGIAKAAIDQQLGGGMRVATGLAWLREPGATFVTLTRNNELRGCIGRYKQSAPLRKTCMQTRWQPHSAIRALSH